ncbi:MAG: hypothetical protein WCC17_17965 [Candidatus Nitrosopolaris sp.]|jgi:hypothetical protein
MEQIQERKRILVTIYDAHKENWIITSLSLNVGYTRDGVNQAPKTTVASYSAEDAETYAG